MPENRVQPERQAALELTGAPDPPERREREDSPESEALPDPQEHPDSTVRSLYTIGRLRCMQTLSILLDLRRVY